MPKVYYYTDAEVGHPWIGPDGDRVEECKKHNIPHPRFVWYDWPGFTRVADPSEADVYVTRQRLIGLADEVIESLPYYKGDARHRHVFFGLGPDGGAEAFRDLSQFPGVFVRACVNQTMLESNPDTIVWPWPVDDLGEYMPLPPGGFQYDAVFQGWTAGHTEPVLRAVEQSNLRLHVHRLSNFWPNIDGRDPEEGSRLRKSYLESMQISRVALCPSSNPRGSMRYRFYEAMSMGRVCLLLGDECVLPLSDRITWQDCIIRVANHDVLEVGAILERWLARHTDAEILAMGARARQVWEKYLWRGNWGVVLGALVRRRLGLGAL